MNLEQHSLNWQQLSSSTSLGKLIAQRVADFRVVPLRSVLGDDSTPLVVPHNWNLASSGETSSEPVRTLVTGHRSRGGWQGCDTLAASQFTGAPTAELGHAHATEVLQNLRASGITWKPISVAPAQRLWGVRSSGYVTVAGLRIWTQFITYVEGSHDIGRGRLFEHGQFIVSQQRTRLLSDTTTLSEAVRSAICSQCCGQLDTARGRTQVDYEPGPGSSDS